MLVLSFGMSWGSKIRKAREARNWSQNDLARKAGTNQATVDRLESGATQHSKYLAAVLEALDLTGTVPLGGYVGAGSEAHYYADGHQLNEYVPMPLGGTKQTRALEIRGNSLGPIFNKWIVYYDEVHLPPTEALIRELCVVQLVDGRVLVKQLLRGSQPGLWHLASQTEELIEDVVIDWAAKVTDLKPR